MWMFEIYTLLDFRQTVQQESVWFYHNGEGDESVNENHVVGLSYVIYKEFHTTLPYLEPEFP